MKITKTIDVSHLSDQEVEMLSLASNIQDKLRDAKSIIESVVKILRRGQDSNSFLSVSPREMADEIEKMAKAKGLL
jgi:hypothetical protein